MPPARPQLKNIIIVFAAVVIGFGLGVGAVRYERLSANTDLAAMINRIVPSVPTDVETFRSVWGNLHNQYVNKNVNDSQLIAGAIAGMVNAVGDPYTVYMDKTAAQTFQNEISGSFDGIGLELGYKNQKITVIAPLSDSPAAAAGLRAADVILAINGSDAQSLTLDEAVSKIRGPQGTEVSLLIKRGTDEPFTVKLTRQKITVASVKSSIENKSGKKIAVINLSSFTTDTDRLFRQAAQQALNDRVSGFIIDLRNNPGGYLDQAVKVASAIIPDGTIVSEVDRNGTKRNLTAAGNAILAGQKIIVLINSGSASASEILAGALQDTQRATIIGETSYGKGSVQELLTLNDGSNLKITIAKWLTPKGTSISEAGIKPDIEVPLTVADYNASRDPQIDRAYSELVGS